MKRRTSIVTVKPVSTLPDGRAGQTGSYKVVRQPDAPLMPPEQMLPIQPVTEQIIGSPVNRAMAFNIRTLSLSVVIGLALWLIGGGLIARFPLFSLAAIAFFVGGFLVVWLVAFWLDAQNSPAGIARYNARRFWDYLEREQDERHRRMFDD